MKSKVFNKIRFIAVVAAFIVIVVCSFNLIFGFATAKSYTITELQTITVQPGDTLWNLANKYMPDDMDIYEAIYKLGELNNIDASTLYAGMKIQVPIYG